MHHLEIFGVRITHLTVPELHERIEQIIHEDRKALVLNANVNCLNLAHEQDWLRAFLNTAPIVFIDGAGVTMAARMLGHRVPPRITYADWMWNLAAFCQERDFSFFFLGARPDVAVEAAKKLQEKHPRLGIVGTYHGYFDKTPGGEENERVIRTINAASPHILVVGFGMPLQERWLMHNWEILDANIFLTGGACFDYLSGQVPRAPRWMLDNGLEWLHRLLLDPGRLWKRYLIGNPLFLYRVARQRVGLLRILEANQLLPVGEKDHV